MQNPSWKEREIEQTQTYQQQGIKKIFLLHQQAGLKVLKRALAEVAVLEFETKSLRFRKWATFEVSREEDASKTRIT